MQLNQICLEPNVKEELLDNNMTYKEMLEIAKKGKIIMLSNFKGYFKWNFGSNSLIFQNGDYQCSANSLDILNRNDFYYIT